VTARCWNRSSLDNARARIGRLGPASRIFTPLRRAPALGAFRFFVGEKRGDPPARLWNHSESARGERAGSAPDGCSRVKSAYLAPDNAFPPAALSARSNIRFCRVDGLAFLDQPLRPSPPPASNLAPFARYACVSRSLHPHPHTPRMGKILSPVSSPLFLRVFRVTARRVAPTNSGTPCRQDTNVVVSGIERKACKLGENVSALRTPTPTPTPAIRMRVAV